jgi:hypothetical protein
MIPTLLDDELWAGADPEMPVDEGPKVVDDVVLSGSSVLRLWLEPQADGVVTEWTYVYMA